MRRKSKKAKLKSNLLFFLEKRTFWRKITFRSYSCCRRIFKDTFLTFAFSKSVRPPKRGPNTRDDSFFRWHKWYDLNFYCRFIINIKFTFFCLMGSCIPFDNDWYPTHIQKKNPKMSTQKKATKRLAFGRKNIFFAKGKRK